MKVAAHIEDMKNYPEDCGCEHCEAARTKSAIAAELYIALKRLGASPELLSIIGSYGDTLSEEEVLRLLKDWNATGKVIHKRQ